jgi:hypothetical protein
VTVKRIKRAAAVALSRYLDKPLIKNIQEDIPEYPKVYKGELSPQAALELRSAMRGAQSLEDAEKRREIEESQWKPIQSRRDEFDEDFTTVLHSNHDSRDGLDRLQVALPHKGYVAARKAVEATIADEVARKAEEARLNQQASKDSRVSQREQRARLLNSILNTPDDDEDLESHDDSIFAA